MCVYISNHMNIGWSVWARDFWMYISFSEYIKWLNLTGSGDLQAFWVFFCVFCKSSSVRVII